MFSIYFLPKYELFVDLPRFHKIPYFGVLYLQEVASEETNELLHLPDHLSDNWDRVVLLGNQPIVHAEGSIVRVSFLYFL
jgi:hypothetical protein